MLVGEDQGNDFGSERRGVGGGTHQVSSLSLEDPGFRAEAHGHPSGPGGPGENGSIDIFALTGGSGADTNQWRLVRACHSQERTAGSRLDGALAPIGGGGIPPTTDLSMKHTPSPRGASNQPITCHFLPIGSREICPAPLPVSAREMPDSGQDWRIRAGLSADAPTGDRWEVARRDRWARATIQVPGAAKPVSDGDPDRRLPERG